MFVSLSLDNGGWDDRCELSDSRSGADAGELRLPPDTPYSNLAAHLGLRSVFRATRSNSIANNDYRIFCSIDNWINSDTKIGIFAEELFKILFYNFY